MTHEEREILRALYPELINEELDVARENLEWYLELVWEMVEERDALNHKEGYV